MPSAFWPLFLTGGGRAFTTKLKKGERKNTI